MSTSQDAVHVKSWGKRVWYTVKTDLPLGSAVRCPNGHLHGVTEDQELSFQRSLVNPFEVCGSHEDLVKTLALYGRRRRVTVCN